MQNPVKEFQTSLGLTNIQMALRLGIKPSVYPQTKYYLANTVVKRIKSVFNVDLEQKVKQYLEYKSQN